MPSNKNYSEDAKNFFLNEDNKKKKKVLKEKYGMSSFGESDDAQPEILNKFLDNVIKFEEGWENSERKKVIEILGNPKFKSADRLKPDELEIEIAEVLAKYAVRNINVDVIEKEDITNKVFYKFLTEELPNHETDFIVVEGMTLNFIYEEFHPSNKLDAKNIIEWFSYPYLRKDKKEMKIYLTERNLTFNGVRKSRTGFMEEMISLIPDLGKDVKNKIVFKNFEFTDNKGKVLVDFIISYKDVKRDKSVRKKKILTLLFDLKKGRSDGYDIKGCTVQENKDIKISR